MVLSACGTDDPPPVPSRSIEPSSPAAASDEVPPRGTIDVGVIEGVSEEVATAALGIALDHPRTRPVHEASPFEVTEVAAHQTISTKPATLVRVVIEFSQPLPPGLWPDDETCAIYRESDDITGVVWLVDPRAGEVAAYSPQWDYEVACS